MNVRMSVNNDAPACTHDMSVLDPRGTCADGDSARFMADSTVFARVHDSSTYSTAYTGIADNKTTTA